MIYYYILSASDQQFQIWQKSQNGMGFLGMVLYKKPRNDVQTLTCGLFLTNQEHRLLHGSSIFGIAGQ
jgi:hypothetical protein